MIKINSKQLEYFNALWKGNPDFAQGHGNNRELQSKSFEMIVLKLLKYQSRVLLISIQICVEVKIGKANAYLMKI